MQSIGTKIAIGGSIVLLLGFACRATPANDQNTERSHYWPQWRGPNMDGVVPHGDPPVKWSESKNIVWKVDLPGLGASTPIVWKDLVLVQTVEPVGEEFSSKQQNQGTRGK